MAMTFDLLLPAQTDVFGISGIRTEFENTETKKVVNRNGTMVFSDFQSSDEKKFETLNVNDEFWVFQ